MGLWQPPAGTHTASCWCEGRLDLHVMSSGCPSPDPETQCLVWCSPCLGLVMVPCVPHLLPLG